MDPSGSRAGDPTVCVGLPVCVGLRRLDCLGLLAVESEGGCQCRNAWAKPRQIWHHPTGCTGAANQGCDGCESRPEKAGGGIRLFFLVCHPPPPCVAPVARGSRCTPARSPSVATTRVNGSSFSIGNIEAGCSGSFQGNGKGRQPVGLRTNCLESLLGQAGHSGITLPSSLQEGRTGQESSWANLP